MGRETGYFHRKPFPRFSPVLLVVPVAGAWEHGARGRIREFLCVFSCGMLVLFSYVTQQILELNGLEME